MRCVFLPVVCEGNNSLLDLITDKLDFILDLQARLLNAVDSLDRRHIPQPHLHGTREALLAVLAQVLEQNALLAIPVDRRRALEILLSPAHSAAVQSVRAVVDGQVVALAVEVVDLAARDAVRDATDVLAKERVVLGAVGVCRGEAEDDIRACDLELLDDAALGQESEGVGELFVERHGCGRVMMRWDLVRMFR